MAVDVADMTALARLRAFEDRVLPGEPRPFGEIEDGPGSRFESLPAEDQQHHRDLHSLTVAEHLLNHAAAEHARMVEVHAKALAQASASARHISTTETVTTTTEEA
jgi:hypothetical protein